MAHDHSEHSHETAAGELQSKTGLRSAFLLVVIIAGLFIASLNFMQAMSVHDEAPAHGGHDAAAPAHHEAGNGAHASGEAAKPAEHAQHEATVPATGHDSAQHETAPAHH